MWIYQDKSVYKCLNKLLINGDKPVFSYLKYSAIKTLFKIYKLLIIRIYKFIN